MAKRLALGFLGVASVAVLLIFLVGLPGAAWPFAVLVMGFPIALVTLAVSCNGRVGRLRVPLAALAILLQCGVLGVLAFTDSGRSLFGLPLSLHFLLVAVWLGPLVVTTVSYAVLFPELGIDDELLGRLDQMRRQRS